MGRRNNNMSENERCVFSFVYLIIMFAQLMRVWEFERRIEQMLFWLVMTWCIPWSFSHEVVVTKTPVSLKLYSVRIHGSQQENAHPLNDMAWQDFGQCGRDMARCALSRCGPKIWWLYQNPNPDLDQPQKKERQDTAKQLYHPLRCSHPRLSWRNLDLQPASWTERTGPFLLTNLLYADKTVFIINF